MRTEDPLSYAANGSIEIEAEALHQPFGDAAFTRLLLNLAGMDHPAMHSPGHLSPEPAAWSPEQPTVPAAMPAPAPSSTLDPVPVPVPLPAAVPPRAEDLPPPWLDGPSPEPRTPSRPSLPEALQLEQRWDPELEALIWVRDGEPIGLVRGAVRPAPILEPQLTVPPPAPPPELFLIA